MPKTPEALANLSDASRVVFSNAAPDSFEILLQGGVYVPVQGVCTLREFLCEQMEVCGEYAKERIQTIFLNGSVVDDFDATIIREDSRLALSAAMPGLVGATMRRGGYYAAMRQGITYHPRDLTLHQDSFLVELRLYNFIARELAELFLTRGVWLRASDFREFLASRPDAFFTGVAVSLDDRSSPAGRLAAADLADLKPLVFLRLEHPAPCRRDLPRREPSAASSPEEGGLPEPRPQSPGKREEERHDHLRTSLRR